MLTTVLDLVAAALVVAGVALGVGAPAALVVAGLLVALVSWRLTAAPAEGGEQR